MVELGKLTGLAIRTVDDLANAIRTGLVDPSKIPVNYIVREGNVSIHNTRTVQALERAGIPRNAFNAIDRTGDEIFEDLVSAQLKRNNLTSRGARTATQE